MNEKRKNKKALVHISTVIDNLLDKFHNQLGHEFLQILKIWQNEIGKDIAENTKPVSLQGERLLVFVPNSVWMQELQFLKNDIIFKINSAFGKDIIKEIQFKINY